jgi:hypothetical protein
MLENVSSNAFLATPSFEVVPQSRQSNTFKLPNGNKVTVTTGSSRRGMGAPTHYKTVTVRRPDGSTDSRTYRRGQLLGQILGPYSSSVPAWAKQGLQYKVISPDIAPGAGHVYSEPATVCAVGPCSNQREPGSSYCSHHGPKD